MDHNGINNGDGEPIYLNLSVIDDGRCASPSVQEHLGTYSWNKSNGCNETYDVTSDLDPYIIFKKWMNSFWDNLAFSIPSVGWLSAVCGSRHTEANYTFNALLVDLSSECWLRKLTWRSWQSVPGRFDDGTILKEELAE